MDSEFVGQVYSSDMDWIESMYQRFMNHETLDPSWKYFFEGYQLGQAASPSEASTKISGNETIAMLQEQKSQFLCTIYRYYGYLQSQISTLAPTTDSRFIQEKIAKIDLDEQVPSAGLLPKAQVSVRELIEALKKCYCGSLTLETLTCTPELQEFVWNLMEKRQVERFAEQLLRSYKDLCKATFFEEFLQIKFTGQKRFSLEGGETLVPMLEHLVHYGSALGISNYVLGMAHRGRLNVLTNVLGKPYRYVFMEFEDDPAARGLESVGDVKYHKGYVLKSHQKDRETTFVMLPNASHLESVDPIVEGVVAALQHQGHAGKEQSSLAILVHGDAAFSGQGVVYETLQLSRVPGYSTEGTLHIVVNNYIGFTAVPRESRSTPYCTDIAKMLGIPVFRVNSEDVVACIEAIEYALQVRERFSCDVIIDLCCYRKYGHNESDDPSVTAPLLYDQIKRKKSIRELFRQYLLEGQFADISEETLASIEKEIQESLNREFQVLKGTDPEPFPKKECHHCDRLNNGELILHDCDVSLDRETLFHMSSRLCGFPDNFHPHPKIKTLLEKRMKMAEGGVGYDWAMAEELAFASLLIEGYNLRLSGQDSIRGTFSQRHLVWSDTVTGDTYSPLYHLSAEQGSVEMYNSPLSEYAILGFEYGYAQQALKTLVLWEAQFGDFANGAQIIFDQYISSGIQKWDLHSDIVLLLPHGYEGQGPEHSSSRIERYLQLAANWNFQVVLPSTPVQYFRILREHAKRDLSLPLVIFTPKLLLRYPQCVSSIEEFTEPGGFRAILEDADPNYDASILVLCSGKIYYDYAEMLPQDRRKDFSCLRIESLYPLALEDLVSLIDKYSHLKHFVWLQEESKNMGAYDYMFMALQDILPEKLLYIGRPRSSSTASGSAKLSRQELVTCMETLFSLR
ncbi:2-oxoglutarate dehydrogenase, E1 subunit [Chlamydia pneumoniae TW-183]|uniref:oxoglutarate dehydrogenase (succinyl-transferring) n=2 Tax=Chlamydia pneumoniae TaxID=83558 RepID=Q9Z8G5_CHLPN|nr:2-oxoglutarate dehydrogenase E1 component [Chlamydia pneumoniae]AAD18522.1 Oxoglutarate Dehydrogenase [Chlamydia pneumoniae CWL029]AAF38225.1 2-oxoglutarate dehydrogenase, E1 component [Chlamydia pneumoniae AR39]AAP98321.1 2-oxoglutarate dehydrogenase, E1 subunit [Chlamydia pneumoniae TW-183]CRI32880.1 2-oxoglutarate dehydrogenase E1 component [Chlamydia pneumoniae]CRI35743.1 2-oxoglutarate dehydrogenase E1 component [Chlamydia pneumoniae]